MALIHLTWENDIELSQERAGLDIKKRFLTREWLGTALSSKGQWSLLQTARVQGVFE